jgi:hypothetical protein
LGDKAGAIKDLKKASALGDKQADEMIKMIQLK